MSMAKYQLSSVQASYGKTPGVAIDRLTIASGELCVLVGPNGSGKSTLLGILAFLDQPGQGTVSFDGVPVNWTQKESVSLRQRVTLLHQNPYLFSGSVARNVAFGLTARGTRKKETKNVIHESLEKVGLDGFESRTARRLSGGEIRRVALARALACQPEVLLLDEPMANVDRASAELFESLIASLSAGGMTIVISSHDERLAARLGARIIYLEDGKLGRAPEPMASACELHQSEENHANS
jgi:tungstate transport system ATP-binding protein